MITGCGVVAISYLWARDVSEKLRRSKAGRETLEGEFEALLEKLCQSQERETNLSSMLLKAEETNATFSEQIRRALEATLSTYKDGFEKGVERGKK